MSTTAIDFYQELFSSHANLLAKEISDRPNINVEEISEMLKVRLMMLIEHACIERKTPLQERVEEIKRILKQPNLSGHSRHKYQSEMNEIKNEFKKENTILHTIENVDQYDALKEFVKKNFGQESLDIFYASQDRWTHERAKHYAIQHNAMIRKHKGANARVL